MDAYSILGISGDATLEKLKKAYRTKAKKHHPDMGGDAWAFNQIREAYEQIMRERQRESTCEKRSERKDKAQDESTSTVDNGNDSSTRDLVPRLFVPRWAMIAAGTLLGTVLGVCTSLFLGVSVVDAGAIGAITGATLGCFSNTSSRSIKTKS